MIGFFLSRHQYTIKPWHIRHLLGAYTPNDEDVSLLEQIAADKGPPKLSLPHKPPLGNYIVDTYGGSRSNLK